MRDFALSGTFSISPTDLLVNLPRLAGFPKLLAGYFYTGPPILKTRVAPGSHALCNQFKASNAFQQDKLSSGRREKESLPL